MKVLIVDDEMDVEQLYRQRFRKEIKAGELEMMFAFSTNEAMNVLSELAPMDVILVLSDINMPGLTGFDLLKFTKEKYPHLNVVMVSAYGDADNMNKASSLGASGFLTKPVDFNLLKEKIFSLK
ncbi:MAG: response regulator [Bacteroidota bacterium]